MSDESVTFGVIPGTERMYTADQIDAKISGLERLITASPEEVSGVIDAITNVTGNLVTKSGLADLIAPNCGVLLLASGVDSGCGVGGIYYNKSGVATRLLDASMICGSDSGCGEEIFGSGMYLLGRLMESGYDAGKIESGIDAANQVYSGLSSAGGSEGSPCGLNRALSGLKLLVDALPSGSGDNNVVPVMIPSGSTICDAVASCISSGAGGAVTQDNVCELVSGCISGMGINWAAVNNAISGLQNAVCGLTGKISGMVDDLALTIADALTAADSLVEHEDLPEEIRRKVQKAHENSQDPDVVIPMTDEVKRRLGADILQDIVPSIDDVKDAVSDGVAVDPNDPDLPPGTPTDVEDVAAADSTAGDTAENASDTADSIAAEKGDLEQYGDSLL